MTKLQEQLAHHWQRRWEQVALMHDTQGMSFQAIADILGISRSRAFQLYLKTKRNPQKAASSANQTT